MNQKDAYEKVGWYRPKYVKMRIKPQIAIFATLILMCFLGFAVDRFLKCNSSSAKMKKKMLCHQVSSGSPPIVLTFIGRGDEPSANSTV